MCLDILIYVGLSPETQDSSGIFEGLGWDSLLEMVHNPGGDCYWVGG